VARPRTCLVWGGAFERCPHLRAAITEGTAVWVPEYLRLLDFRYADTPYSAKLGDYTSHLSMKPSEYFARNVLIGASCMPRREAEMRHEVGIRNIAWGSDFPHPEGSFPHTWEQMHETFTGLPEDEIARMLAGNAAEFYRFDLGKLDALAERIGPEKSSFAAR